MAFAALALCRFDKKWVLPSLILHEIVLFLWVALMVVATIFSKDLPRIMVHPIGLLALFGIGYGIFKTVKAIKAENGKNAPPLAVKRGCVSSLFRHFLLQ